MQTNNTCEWRTKTGAPRAIDQSRAEQGVIQAGVRPLGAPPVRIHTPCIPYTVKEYKKTPV